MPDRLIILFDFPRGEKLVGCLETGLYELKGTRNSENRGNYDAAF